MRLIVNLIKLHKSACLSGGCVRTESVNKICDRFLFIFSFRYGKKKSVSRVLFIFHMIPASMLLRKQKFCLTVWSKTTNNIIT